MFDTHFNFLPSEHCSLKKKGDSWWCFQSNDCGNCRLFHDSLCCRYGTHAWCLLGSVAAGQQCTGTIAPVAPMLVLSGLAGLRVNMQGKFLKTGAWEDLLYFLRYVLLFFFFCQSVTRISWTNQVTDELQPLLHIAGYRNTEVITEQKWSRMKGGCDREGVRGKLHNLLP